MLLAEQKCFHGDLLDGDIWGTYGSLWPSGTEGGRVLKKERDGVFEGVDETKQPTGYKTVSIILSQLQEREAWNKISQITHHSVWYINSHFRTQTKKEKKNHASHWKWDS